MRSVAFAVFLVASVACESTAPEAKPGAAARGPGVTTVEVQPPRLGAIERTLALTGEVLAERLVELTPRDSGQLASLAVDEGQSVLANTEIARLDEQLQLRQRSEASTRLASAEARIAQAQAQLDAQEAVVERKRRLVERGASPTAELDRLEDELLVAKESLAVARAQRAEAAAAVTTAEVALARRGIVAPFDGVVLKRHVSVGAMLSPQSPLLTLLDPSSLVFSARVAERYLPSIAPDSTARLRFDALGERVVDGKLLRVGDVVERSSRTVELRFALTVDSRGLRPGMFGRAELVVARLEQALCVPVKALQRAEGKVRVWVVDGDKAKRVDVELLLENETEAAVSGLDPKAAVIVSGTRGLRPDAPVRVAPQPEPSPDAAKKGPRP